MSAAADTVRVLSKGLDVLRLLNERVEASSGDLVRLTGLPRPTVHRLLNTLMAEGYVVAQPETRRYRTTYRVRALSQGYREEAWISEAAAPVLDALQRDIVWPSDVATYHDGAMVIRHSTNGQSPLSVVKERAGSRLPVLRSALGQAWLAFIPLEARKAVLDVLAAPASPERELARNARLVGSLLEAVGRNGHAERLGGIVPRTFSLAVPIMARGACRGAINVICFSSALRLERARESLLPKLRSAASAIGARLEALGELADGPAPTSCMERTK